jgi:endo-1,4-beta-xylanase
MKMLYLEPTQNSYDFSNADQMVGWARSNGKQVHGHTLVWNQEIPAWVIQGQPVLLGVSHQPWTQAQLQQIMDSYITTVVGHYKGQVPEWDVVNEALQRDARAADPSAKLCYNEIGAEVAGPEADALYTLISKLHSEGLVDCLGFEMHVSGGGPPEADLESNWRRFASLGVEVHVSEMDDDLSQVPGDEASRLALQAQAYHAAAVACYRVLQCTRFTTWGFTDAATWVNGSNAEPLEFDSNMAPKPAWDAIQRGVQSGA